MTCMGGKIEIYSNYIDYKVSVSLLDWNERPQEFCEQIGFIFEEPIGYPFRTEKICGVHKSINNVAFIGERVVAYITMVE